VASTKASFCNIFEKNHQKTPGFLDWVFSDLELILMWMVASLATPQELKKNPGQDI
jgi:hypothetical protein